MRLHHRNDCDCDLCEARARKKRDDQLRDEGKPTLTHQPFASLLGKTVTTEEFRADPTAPTRS